MLCLYCSSMLCVSVGRSWYISAHATNASKLICKALSSTKWYLFSVIVALILVLAQCCRMNTHTFTHQVCTFEADGDALAERLPDQVPGG